MYAAGKVGSKGRIIGIDIQEHSGVLPANAEIRQGDMLALDVASLGGPASFHVVMSDMAPNTTGRRDLDQFRSFELFMRALEVAKELLVPGGNFVGKIFQSGDFPEAQKAVRLAFGDVRIIRPEAVRTESYEVFIAGLGFGEQKTKAPKKPPAKK
jgi:23S rRNA (uridine2552-2'-O)-methyltransferase